MPEQWNKYGPTAARKHGKPGREMRPKSITIDIHSHVGDPARRRSSSKPHLDPATIPLVAFRRRRDQGAQPEAGGRHRRGIASLDRARSPISTPWASTCRSIMPPPPQCYYTCRSTSRSRPRRWSTTASPNSSPRKPDRFVALRHRADAGRQRGREGARALHAPSSASRACRSSPTSTARNCPIRPSRRSGRRPRSSARSSSSIPTASPQAERFSRFYFNNVIGNPLETTIALHYLIFDGVLERHPNLKILAVHGGGYLGGYSGRIDHAWGARSDCHGNLPHPPTSYLKKIYFDTVVFTPHQLAGAGAPLRRRPRSSWAPTIRSTWPTTIRSGTSCRPRASTTRRAPRSPAATRSAAGL